MGLAIFRQISVIVRGGGDLASGVVYRLHRIGFPVIVTELESPKLVRRTVSFGDAVYRRSCTIEGITARLAEQISMAKTILGNGEVPVIVDETKRVIQTLEPVVVVDARMAKQRLDTTLHDAPLVIALGPGFSAGTDCHAVIETNRGHNLGRVIWKGAAEPNTGVPGSVVGQSYDRVLRAPVDGYLDPEADIGETIKPGQVIGTVGGQPIVASFEGVLRGLIHPRVKLKAGMKVGDLDPRARPEHCLTISDKSRAVGGGVVEAVLSSPQLSKYLKIANHETPRSV